MRDNIETALSRRWFWFACGFEGGLVGLGLLLAWAFGVPGATSFHWRGLDIVRGSVAIVPLLVMLLWLTRSRIPWIQEITRFLDSTVVPVLRAWKLPELALLSSLAGLGEELVFRAVLQTLFQGWMGIPASLLVSNVLFGLCHWVTPAYALLTLIIGMYFGLLFLWTGNLLVPALAHGLYDFIALIYFLRLRRRAGE